MTSKLWLQFPTVCLQEWRNRDGSVSVGTKGCLSSVQGAGERTSHQSPPQLFQHSHLLLSQRRPVGGTRASQTENVGLFLTFRFFSGSSSFWLKPNLNSQCSKAKRVRGSQTRALHQEPGATEDPALQTLRRELSPPYHLLRPRLRDRGRLVPGTLLP